MEPAALRVYPTMETPSMLGGLVMGPQPLPLATARADRGLLGSFLSFLLGQIPVFQAAQKELVRPLKHSEARESSHDG